MGLKILNLTEEEHHKNDLPWGLQRFSKNPLYFIDRAVIEFSSNFQNHPYGRQKLCQLLLHIQYFAMFALESQYNVRKGVVCEYYNYRYVHTPVIIMNSCKICTMGLVPPLGGQGNSPNME
ncbi:hypothetical protein TNCV_1019201 [Trichonephila clavipes]|nr:hypothetical protein TNCV_1019201 [Trichonephila clavipes]